MLKLTHKKSGVVLFGWQVPSHNQLPSEAMIEWLERSSTEWSGDESGIDVHSSACRVAVPGDFVVMREGYTELRVIHGYELPLFWLEAVQVEARGAGEHYGNIGAEARA